MLFWRPAIVATDGVSAPAANPAARAVDSIATVAMGRTYGTAATGDGKGATEMDADSLKDVVPETVAEGAGDADTSPGPTVAVSLSLDVSVGRAVTVRVRDSVKDSVSPDEVSLTAPVTSRDKKGDTMSRVLVTGMLKVSSTTSDGVLTSDAVSEVASEAEGVLSREAVAPSVADEPTVLVVSRESVA
jgi:hypothetical protein